MNDKRVLAPKFIKKANLWMVSVITFDPVKRKDNQKMNWFSTETEAKNYYKEEINVENNIN